MKPFSALGKVGVALLLLNEIRGILVVASILGAWSHSGKAAAPPPDPACASAPQPAAGAACRLMSLAKRARPAATAPAQPSGSNAAIIRPQ